MLWQMLKERQGSRVEGKGLLVTFFKHYLKFNGSDLIFTVFLQDEGPKKEQNSWFSLGPASQESHFCMKGKVLSHCSFTCPN